MKIEWNRVTWYSKLLSLVFFMLIFPIVSFQIGKMYQEIDDIQKEAVTIFLLQK